MSCQSGAREMTLFRMNPVSVEAAKRRRSIAFVVGLFFASRVMVLILAVTSPYLVKTDVYARKPWGVEDPAHYFNRWDVEWYRRVAVEGYAYTPGTESNVVFFPLFPTLVRSLHTLGLHPIWAGMLISSACFAASLWLIHALVLRETGRRKTAEWTTALLAFSPAGVWFTLGMTESLFLFLTLALVWALRSEQWMGAMVIGGLAGLTRPNAFLLALPVVVLVGPSLRSAWRERRWRGISVLLLVALSPALGHASFLAFLQAKFGDWSLSHRVSSLYWHNHFSLSWDSLSSRIPGLGLKLFDPAAGTYVTHVAWSWTLVLLFGVISGVALWRRRASSWHLVYLFAFFAFHSFIVQGATPLGPIARYAAVVPTFYLGVVLASERWPWAQIALFALSSALMALQTVLVFAGYHIN